MTTKLVIHVGLPKTGTSALQYWLDRNRPRLKEQGINYPLPDGTTAEPKHQFLVRGLLRSDFASLDQMVAENDQPKMVVSAEGLTNHLYDFEPAALEEFRSATTSLEKTVVIVLRDKDKWVKSYWKQAVVNPPIARFDYATPLRLEQFCELPRVQRLCDHEQLAKDLRMAFGAHDVRIVSYDGNYLGDVCTAMGIEIHPEMGGLIPGNVSISDDVIELVRQLNESDHPPEVRVILLSALQKCIESQHIGLTNFYSLKGATQDNIIAASAAIGRLVPATDAQQEIAGDLQQLLASPSSGGVREQTNGRKLARAFAGLFSSHGRPG